MKKAEQMSSNDSSSFPAEKGKDTAAKESTVKERHPRKGRNNYSSPMGKDCKRKCEPPTTISSGSYRLQIQGKESFGHYAGKGGRKDRKGKNDRGRISSLVSSDRGGTGQMAPCLEGSFKSGTSPVNKVDERKYT